MNIGTLITEDKSVVLDNWRAALMHPFWKNLTMTRYASSKPGTFDSFSIESQHPLKKVRRELKNYIGAIHNTQQIQLNLDLGLNRSMTKHGFKEAYVAPQGNVCGPIDNFLRFSITTMGINDTLHYTFSMDVNLRAEQISDSMIQNPKKLEKWYKKLADIAFDRDVWIPLPHLLEESRY